MIGYADVDAQRRLQQVDRGGQGLADQAENFDMKVGTDGKVTRTAS